MSLASTSIQRPVLAFVLSAVIVIFGVLGFRELPIRELPSVDAPVITVTTTYTGAPPEVIESQITEPLEESINAVAGIRSIASTSREGRSTIVVEFNLETDLEAAANDVRDRASQARRNLPPDAEPPIVSKSNADSQPILMLSIASRTRDLLELTEVAELLFKPPLQSIPGVAEVDIWGEKRYSMRIYLDTAKLAANRLTPVDVRNALERENVELPSGRIDGEQVELSVRAASRFSTSDEFNAMILREEGGRTVRLSDVGYATIGPENPRSLLKQNGLPNVAAVLRPQPGANQVAISDEFHRRVEELRKELPKDIDVAIGFDTSSYVREAIAQVEETFYIAVLLVVLVIYLFLRDWRSTLIPALAISVSIIGGFFILHLVGFSLNVLTLLGMVLAIGLVVDDAIVVLENIYSKIEQGKPAMQAAFEGSKEIFFAVVATTIALVSVFMPILFVGGAVGKLFREFGAVIGGTVAISAFVALSLTPMLCARLLAPGRHSKFYRTTEPMFEGLNNGYRRLLSAALRQRWFAPVALVATGTLSWFLFSVLPSELAPLEDRGRLRVTATAPEGASFKLMERYMDDLTRVVAEHVPESENLFTMTAPSGGASGSGNSGFIRMTLVNRHDRERSQADIARAIVGASRELPGARVNAIQEPTISVDGTGGRSLPVQFVIQAQNLNKLREALPRFLEAAGDSPALSRVDVDLKFNKPELRVAIDRDLARSLGVSARDIGETLNLALSEQRFGYFIRDGKQYQVLGQLNRDQRDAPPDLHALEVPSTSGAPVRLDSLVSFEERISPPILYRFNRFASATVSASPADGYTLGQGIDATQEIARKTLDESFKTDLSGQSRDFRDSSSSLLFVFVLALALLYLVLAGQFESFRDPFIILLTVPLALAGALAGLAMFGQSMNIFSQIGIIMLIGLVTKNGILIVEFANQRRDHGLSIMEATLEASVARLRPVLMTSACTILGILPIALSIGAGSESRVSMGIAVVGGMILATFLTLLVVPAMYTYLTGKTRHTPQVS